MSLHAVDLIRKKRDGEELTEEEVRFLVDGAARETIPEEQLSAWLMAVFLRGLSLRELDTLTTAMRFSGEVLDHAGLGRRTVDKHSTGGVGDKTSLVLAPLLAAGGLLVPMISGRGLGHTGGTLDKLESIPGFNVHLSLTEFRRVLRRCGCSMIGQTEEIAPADRKLYALRDVTGTVESPYLICASIMSKKLAEGIDALLLDVKTGSGAFMKSEEQAAFLAELMVETGERMGKTTVALITDMDQPLGQKVGNALEVAEALAVLHGSGPHDLRQLCLELGAWMFELGGACDSLPAGRKTAGQLIDSGQALEKFRELVELQGGDPSVIDQPGKLPRSSRSLEILSPTHGYVTAIACEAIGTACVVLGGGRERKEDSVDPSVGIVLHKKVGDAVSRNEPLSTVHYNSESRATRARQLIEESYQICDAPPREPRPLVHRVIQGSGGN